MAEYQLTATDIVVRHLDGAFIPNDPLNEDRVAYEQWLADGGVPDPYVAPPAPPPDASHRLDAGIAAAATTVMAARDAIHLIPHSGALPARFDALLIQLDVLTDAFVAMLQAQADPP